MIETATTTIVHVIPDTWKIVEILATVVAAGGALWFGYSQDRINRRMKELSDYAAAFIAPVNPRNSTDGLSVKNVGRVNLYIHRWEIGPISASVKNPLLLPVDPNSGFHIGIPQGMVGVHFVKLYLTDETSKKYLATGEVNIQAVPVGIQIPQQVGDLSQLPTQQPGTTAQPSNQANLQFITPITAHSYQTKLYEWMI